MWKRIRFGLGTAVVVLGTASLVACQSQPKTVTVTVTRVVRETIVAIQTVEVMVEAESQPSPTPEPSPKNLVVCMLQEPASLFRFGRTLPSETAVLHGLYENDYTSLHYEFQPQGLTKIPSLADGDAQLTPVTVQSGDKVVTATGRVVTLKEGTVVLNADGQEITFTGTPLVMEQLSVEFTMKPRIWSDGTAVTAGDSVYSFRLAGHPDIPADKTKVTRTARYEAIDQLRIRWTGLPGYRDPDYFTNFWPPVPRHIWQDIAPADLPESVAASRMPVGDGPFRIAAWKRGAFIRLEPNPFYYRSEEGFPFLDSVTFRFIPNRQQIVDELLQGKCDIATQDSVDVSQSPFFIVAQADSRLVPHFQTGTVYEHIAFGVDSWQYYGDGDGRPDWFEDVRVRQAMSMCTDRQGMVDTILFGQSEVLHNYVPDTHPLFPADAPQWAYDPKAANALLDEVGYLDTNGDSIREDPLTHESFEVTLGTTTSNVMEQQLTKYFQDNMRQCGIEVELYYLPNMKWLADGPDSPLFGRRFDLGQFAWQTSSNPNCEIFASWQITGPYDEINPETGRPYAGWTGLNETGWWHPGFDRACRAARRSLPGAPGYKSSQQEAMRIFAQNAPAIPLFLRLKLAVTQPDVLNYQIDSTQPSDLWNLYEIDLQEAADFQLAE